jgi:hypothetical protein
MNVDKCLSKLKINKYISRYEFLNNEYMETMYLFEGYKRTFEIDCTKKVEPRTYVPESEHSDSCSSSNNMQQVSVDENVNQSMNVSMKGLETNEQINQPTSDKDSDPPAVSDESATDECHNDVLSKLIKKLYRKLMLKTHPDKHSSHQSQSYVKETNFFQCIQDAYKANDVVKLMWIAYKHNIDIDAECDVCEYMQELDVEIHKGIDALSKNIEDIKTTLAWNWAFADDNQKNFYRNTYNL